MKRGYLILGLFILGIFLIGIVGGATTYCCEKTKQGAWCQNVNSESECDITSINPVTNEPFVSTNAFCDSTDFCKPVTCIDNLEGRCISSPKSVCLGNGGAPSEQPKSEIQQCQLGCCLIGDSAAFITHTACNKRVTYYGVNTDWKANINDELTCLASASPRTKGACVYTKDLVKTCEFTTKEKCQNEIAINSAYSDTKFHGGYLCSAQVELGTSCAPTGKTICDDKYDVRFVDSCNQLGNIYDYRYSPDNPNKEANYLTDYWTTIKEPTCTTSDNPANKDSPTCGDCDSLGGSMCKKKSAGDSVSSGNYLCKNLDCVNYRGQGFTSERYPKHGETWCATDNITAGYYNPGTNTTGGYNPGTTSFKMICSNGEVTNEECPLIDSTRQEICNENISADGFRRANCKGNLWGDCAFQNTSADCRDVNLRDCNWISWNGYYFTINDNGMYLKNDTGGATNEVGTCVPKFQPGFERDEKQNVIGGGTCSLANSVCYVRMTRGAFGGTWSCKTGVIDGWYNNCSCINDANNAYDKGATWASGLNGICVQMGDCGVKQNFLDKPGYSYPDVTKMFNISKEEAK